MTAPISSLKTALPFWASLTTIPVIWGAALIGGWVLLLVPVFTWGLFALLDGLTGIDTSTAHPDTPEEQLFWFRLITLVWAPIQAGLVFGLLVYATQTDHLGSLERIALFFGLGVITGTIGIVYAHELMHQSGRLERWLGDLLMAMALYSHFRSEHLRVHHTHVGTPRDAVTARYNEGFHQFFPRVLRETPVSAFRAEVALLARRGLPAWHISNPFWRYAVLQSGFLALAVWIGGWAGLGLFTYQAFIAIWQLELVNYVEHYGLTRRHLGDGRYEPVRAHHSWNADHRASNWLLINLQRHADHHMKPTRRYPLLQTYAPDEVPTLPFGYPIMTTMAMLPHIWRRRMNPRVRTWRRQHYPDVTDWSAYNAATNPVANRQKKAPT